MSSEPSIVLTPAGPMKVEPLGWLDSFKPWWLPDAIWTQLKGFGVSIGVALLVALQSYIETNSPSWSPLMVVVGGIVLNAFKKYVLDKPLP